MYAIPEIKWKFVFWKCASRIFWHLLWTAYWADSREWHVFLWQNLHKMYHNTPSITNCVSNTVYHDKSTRHTHTHTQKCDFARAHRMHTHTHTTHASSWIFIVQCLACAQKVWIERDTQTQTRKHTSIYNRDDCVRGCVIATANINCGHSCKLRHITRG